MDPAFRISGRGPTEHTVLGLPLYPGASAQGIVTFTNERGPLRTTDRRAIEKHPEYGWGVLRVFPGLQDVALFVLHHHERMDGRGYPGRLAGDDIPLGSRIVSVVDTFDAMTSSRPYRKALSVREALQRLDAAAGTQFDRTIVRCFISLAAELVIEEAAASRAQDDTAHWT